MTKTLFGINMVLMEVNTQQTPSGMNMVLMEIPTAVNHHLIHMQIACQQ